MGRSQSGRTRLRKVTTLALLLVLALMVHDAAVPPSRSISAKGAIFAIDQYRAFVSPKIRGKVTCRFTPTCSAYGRGAIVKYGFAIGSAKALWRIARCGPWTAAGTVEQP